MRSLTLCFSCELSHVDVQQLNESLQLKKEETTFNVAECSILLGGLMWRWGSLSRLSTCEAEHNHLCVCVWVCGWVVVVGWLGGWVVGWLGGWVCVLDGTL